MRLPVTAAGFFAVPMGCLSRFARGLPQSLPILPAVGLMVAFDAGAGDLNGFNLDDSDIPVAEILAGGPPKDGIPAIDRPRFVAAAGSQVQSTDRVIGVQCEGVAKAYPVAILNWHEIVNDRCAGTDIVVSYCPLCGTGMVFSAAVAGRRHTFGVSGLLYNSDVLMYDRETQSLWSQISRRAVTGPLKGTRLHLLAAEHTSWRDWRRRFPRTRVLSRDTGYDRDYDHNPYADYQAKRRLYFPVTAHSQHYHPKETVLGVELDGVYKAYPFAELSRHGQRRFSDRLAQREITVEWYPAERTARIYNAAGEQLPSVLAYWFAWYAFHPQTLVFSAATP